MVLIYYLTFYFYGRSQLAIASTGITCTTWNQISVTVIKVAKTVMFINSVEVAVWLSYATL